MKHKKQYVLKIRYLGFRYHGWAKQKGYKTIQGELDHALNHLLAGQEITTRGASRTDSMVSAELNYCTFKTASALPDDFLEQLRNLLPNDLELLELSQTDSKFNIISASKTKEYHYQFCHQSDFHPFESIHTTPFHEELNIDLMNQGAKLFVGIHSFHNFCHKPKPSAVFQKEIYTSEVIVHPTNPQKYLFKIIGSGFLRHQVRILFGTLINLNRRKITLDDIQMALSDPQTTHKVGFIAPASGLVLKHIELWPPT